MDASQPSAQRPDDPTPDFLPPVPEGSFSPTPSTPDLSQSSVSSASSSSSSTSHPAAPNILTSALPTAYKPTPAMYRGRTAQRQDPFTVGDDMHGDVTMAVTSHHEPSVPREPLNPQAVSRHHERPSVPRQTSFSKRHASFDTPREVPFPSHLLAPNSFRAPSRTLAFSSKTEPSFGRNDRAGIDANRPPESESGPSTVAGSANLYSYTTIHGIDLQTPRPLPPETTVVPGSQSNADHMNWAIVATAQGSDEPHPLAVDPHASPLPSHPNSYFSSLISPVGPTADSSAMPVSWDSVLHTPTARGQSPSSDRSSTGSLPLPSHISYSRLPSTSVLTMDDHSQQPIQGGSSSTGRALNDMNVGAGTRNLTHGRSNTLRRHRDAGPPSAFLQQQAHHVRSSSRRRQRQEAHDTDVDMTDAMSDSDTSATSATAHLTGMLASMPTTSSEDGGGLADRHSMPSYPVTSRPAMGSRRSSEGGGQVYANFPEPDPPTIHPAPPPPLQSDSHSLLPHERYLSHAPPPESTDIAVETSADEYRVYVRLPGFHPEDITLVTRRHRVLHVMGDKWGDDGGHFDRRISFGYDAEMSHVSGEFDGTTLCLHVPRKRVNGRWFGSAD